MAVWRQQESFQNPLLSVEFYHFSVSLSMWLILLPTLTSWPCLRSVLDSFVSGLVLWAAERYSREMEYPLKKWLSVGNCPFFWVIAGVKIVSSYSKKKCAVTLDLKDGGFSSLILDIGFSYVKTKCTSIDRWSLLQVLRPWILRVQTNIQQKARRMQNLWRPPYGLMVSEGQV